MKTMRLAAVLAVTMGMTACYGPFSLTKKLHKWNGEVGGKWVNEGVFLGLVILPVYTFAALGDAVIFNSVEFWTGKNPVTAKKIRSLETGGRQAVLIYTPEERRLRVDSFEKGRPASTLVFEPGAEGMVARDGKGEVLMTARTVDGRVVLADAAGRQVGSYDPASLAEMSR